jgi:integrase
MPVTKRKDSPYWQIRFEIAGHEVRQSSGTKDKFAAQQLEKQLYDDLWRQIKLGEKKNTWGEAIEKCKEEFGRSKSWQTMWERIVVLNEYIGPNDLLTDIDGESIGKLRKLLQLRTTKGHGHKTSKPWKDSTVNRTLAELSKILRKCAEPTKEGGWGLLQSAAPRVSLLKIPKKSPKWISREQARRLLTRYPKHTRDMMILALATGLRRKNVTHLRWRQVDMVRCVAWIAADETKTEEPIAIPLNEEAMAVLHRWKHIHDEAGEEWTAEVHEYVFVYRRRAPIKQVTTRMWRRECAAAGLQGTTFHTMRHSWASWHIQGETPLRLLMELGGWRSLAMPLRYTHVSAGHLAAYKDRTLIGTETVTVNPDGKTAEGSGNASS